MSDVPLSPSTPAPAGTTLAQAILALLPQQRAQGEGQPGGEAAEEAGAADGLPAGRREAAGPSAAVHDASTGWRGWLGGLLCRLSWAAATSGSSIAELTQASAGGGGLTAGSRTSSVETFTSARSSSSDLFGSACSDDDLP